MKDIPLLIFVAILILGLYVALHSLRSFNAPVQVWSDFKAFSAQVAADESAKHVLKYGGEVEGTDFDYLLKRIWSLHDNWVRCFIVGIVISLLSVIGIWIELKYKKASV